MNTVTFDDKKIDFDAARLLMDDDICDVIHDTVDTDQEFIDAYLAPHFAKYGSEFVFN